MRTVTPPRLLRRFLIFISQKVASYVFKHVPGSAVDSIQFILELEVFKRLFYLRTDPLKCLLLSWLLLCVEIVALIARILPLSLFVVFTNIFISPSFM